MASTAPAVMALISRAARHAPDLTDAAWIFSGDDLRSGGLTKHPSDVEWTVRYGIRSGNEYARGVEADMLAYDPGSVVSG